MAKIFYSAQEAAKKLSLTLDELKALVRDGQLREFRDGGEIKYKLEEVDGLAENLETLSGSLGGSTGELILEPADETSMGLTGSDMLTLDEAARTEGDATVVGDDKEDTVITSVGVSVFDDEEVQEVDPRAKTVMTPDKKAGSSGADLSALSASGSSSGLLDLTRESDDTSLGAELLDEIYTEDQEAGLPEMGEATRAGIDAMTDEREHEKSREEVFARSAEMPATPAPATRVVAVPILVEDEGGPIEMGLSGAMLGAILVLAVSGIAVSANLQGVAARILEPLYTNMIYLLIGSILVVGIAFGAGFFLGKRGQG